MTSAPHDSDPCQDCDCLKGLFDCIARVRGHFTGDRFAGSELVVNFDRKIRGMVANMRRSTQQADRDDCFQDIMLKVFGTKLNGNWRLQEWLNHDDRSPFCAWLFTVASHHLIECLRRPLPPALLELQDWLVDRGQPRPQELEPGKLAAVYECLGQADEDSQKLFRLRIEERLPWSAVADEMGISERMAHYRWAELLQMFEWFLKQRGYEIHSKVS